MKKILPYILILVVGFLIGILCRPKHFRDPTKMFTDTLVVTDTHVIEKPVLVERTIKDSLLVAVVDTMWIHDTCYIALPMETKTYKGEEYYAEVSGYKPSLDYIEVYPKTTIVTEKVTLDRERNALGLGLDMDYINTISMPIYLEYSYLLHRNVEFSARLLYDIPTHSYGVGLGAKVSVGW